LVLSFFPKGPARIELMLRLRTLHAEHVLSACRKERLSVYAVNELCISPPAVIVSAGQ